MSRLFSLCTPGAAGSGSRRPTATTSKKYEHAAWLLVNWTVNRRPACGLGALILGLALCAALSARGSGTIVSCTEQEFTNALAGGGLVLFSSDCSLTLSKTVFLTADSTVIDSGGHSVTISGGGSVRLFSVSGGLQLAGLSLVNGR
ncbi:MAG TPA: hypothetical protein VHI52_16400, partial [Verrucomicrobiae bacterium]|nr:hypothetical protein [Verrucomicrobiae bacterium]